MTARLTPALGLLWAHGVWADVYTYECDSLPEVAGWDLTYTICEPEQWPDELGHLVQYVPLCESFPGVGSQFDYGRLIGDLSQETAWFAEWRVITDGPSEELPWTAPAALVVWDGDGIVLYHFSIADDQVRFIRHIPDNPILYFDIESGVPHTFRVEVFGQRLGDTYAVYIDGVPVDAGMADGPLWHPPWPPEVVFRAKSKFEPSTTTWDYIRWGTIPSIASGDFNSDEQVDSVDFYFFHECLSTPAGSWPGCLWADFDFDGDVDCDDAAEFLLAWTAAGELPSIPECGGGCIQDLDGSANVDAADLALLLGAWGPNPGHPGDFNGDNLVNASDLAQLLGAWGPCE